MVDRSGTRPTGSQRPTNVVTPAVPRSPVPDINIDIGIILAPAVFGERRRRVGTKRTDADIPDLPRAGLVPAVPRVPDVPAPRVPPQTPPSPPPFPRGPAANDPAFSIGRLILARGLAAIGAVIFARDILEMIERDRSIERQRENIAKTKAEIERRARIKRFGRDIETIPGVEGAPIEVPEVPTAPTQRPVPVPIFVPPAPPEIVPFPREIPGFPPARPAPVSRPSPGTPRLPRVATPPNVAPLIFGLTPGFFVGSPASTPFSRVAPRPSRLTRDRSTGVQLGQLTTSAPQTSAQTQADQCQAVKRRRRKKGKCREGFFVETPTETRFITWRTKECDTVPGRKRIVNLIGGF